jgi:hypothetical protein
LWVLGSNGFYSAQAAGIAFEYEPSTGGYYGLCEAVAATNIVLWSRDLTNAAWTKSNVTATKDQAGIDGVANSATRLAATAGNGTALQAITLASSSRKQSAFVKRVVGSGTLEMTTDNGTTWTAVTVTASWTRVEIAAQTLANPTVGFRIGTSGDEIAVDFVQNELGAPGVATSPIPTTTVAVTRAADVWTSTASSFPIGTAFTSFIDYSLPVNGTDGYAFGLSDNTDNNFVGIRIGTGEYKVVTAGVTQAAMVVAGALTAGRREISGRAKLNDSAATMNGAAIVADTVCTVPVVDRLCFGRHRAAGTVPMNLPLKLRRFVHVPRGLSDAELPNWRFV